MDLSFMTANFSYDLAFSRNIGWVTPTEQSILRRKRVAIGGSGGVGAVHALTLARLGVGAFHIADFDTYDIPNFNRQVAAAMSTLGQPKVEVVERMLRDINPEADIRVFKDGVTDNNMEAFLHGVDFYLDSYDFFAFDVRQKTFARCAELGIPATTAAPLGMSTAVLNFLPGQMTFEDYFQWGSRDEGEKVVRFLVGLAPGGLHRPYLVWPSAVNLAERRGPSTIMACQLCAGVAATEALKILLKRGKVRAAPHGMQFDAYRGKLTHTWRPGGNRNPLQRIAIAIGKRIYRQTLKQA